MKQGGVVHGSQHLLEPAHRDGEGEFIFRDQGACRGIKHPQEATSALFAVLLNGKGDDARAARCKPGYDSISGVVIVEGPST